MTDFTGFSLLNSGACLLSHCLFLSYVEPPQDPECHLFSYISAPCKIWSVTCSKKFRCAIPVRTQHEYELMEMLCFFPKETIIFLSRPSYRFDTARFWNTLYRCLFSICWTRTYSSKEEKQSLPISYCHCLLQTMRNSWVRFATASFHSKWRGAFFVKCHSLLAVERRLFSVSSSPSTPASNEETLGPRQGLSWCRKHAHTKQFWGGEEKLLY